MKEKKNVLVSMVDYVLSLEKTSNECITSRKQFVVDVMNKNCQYIQKINNYATFLNQPLELWMFVPVGEDGKVLEEVQKPMGYDTWVKGNGGADGIKCVEYRNYQKAKERCLFEGVEIRRDSYKSTKREFTEIKGLRINTKLMYHSGEIESRFNLSEKYKTIEHLIPLNLELTPTALKQIEL